MAQIANNLKKKLESSPTQPHNVIVRVNGDMEVGQQQLEAAGFQIRRKLGLIKGFAVTGPGQNVQALAQQPWVTSIEEDQQVRTM